MIKKSLTKLVGLKKEDFDKYVESGQIQVRPARLIPVFKTGDEMTLTSIFLSTLKLVKEFRDSIFKELKLSRSGRVYYYTEANFKDIDTSRIDGLIIIVIKGVIADAAFFEMKNKNNNLDIEQIQRYINISKKLKVNKLVTVSNEFVTDPTHSPVKIKAQKSVNLFHFSWSYLKTKGQLFLLKNNDLNIQDEDQIEIMKEVLFYFDNPISGVTGYNQMKPSWKELAENIRAQKPLKVNDLYISDAILSWYEEEKDMSLLLSRKLGVLVKSFPKTKDSIKNDIKRIVKDNCINGGISIKNSVSDIKIHIEFERRIVRMSIKVIPPLDKGNVAKISWISKQLDNCKKKTEDLFNKLENDIWLEANIKYAKENLKIKLTKLNELADDAKGKDIQAFQIVLINDFGAKFASQRKFIELIEGMILNYYEGVVQHLKNWNPPAPKLVEDDNN